MKLNYYKETDSLYIECQPESGFEGDQPKQTPGGN